MKPMAYQSEWREHKALFHLWMSAHKGSPEEASLKVQLDKARVALDAARKQWNKFHPPISD